LGGFAGVFKDGDEGVFAAGVGDGDDGEGAFPDGSLGECEEAFFDGFDIDEFAHHFHARVGAALRGEGVS